MFASAGIKRLLHHLRQAGCIEYACKCSSFRQRVGTKGEGISFSSYFNSPSTTTRWKDGEEVSFDNSTWKRLHVSHSRSCAKNYWASLKGKGNLICPAVPPYAIPEPPEKGEGQITEDGLGVKIYYTGR